MAHGDEDDERGRVTIHLTEQQIDTIADRAVEKAFDKIYVEVGKSVLRKIAWALGILVTVVMLWLAGNGKLPK